MISPEQFFKVASYQGPIAEGDFEKNIKITLSALSEAESTGIDVLCMPECFLHGYFSTKAEALAHSIDLNSAEFTSLLKHFSPYQKITLLLGINERDGDHLFNTVLVIDGGQLTGKYRKAYTYPPYDYYSLGTEFPVFEKRGVKFSVIICYDSVFREPALISALNGAQILFFPMFNRISKTDPMAHVLHRKSHFIARAFDCNCWVVASDITWDDDTHACPGYATILDGDGQIVAVSRPFETMLLSYSIPIESLRKRKTKRLYGNVDLLKQVLSASKSPLKALLATELESTPTETTPR